MAAKGPPIRQSPALHDPLDDETAMLRRIDRFAVDIPEEIGG